MNDLREQEEHSERVLVYIVLAIVLAAVIFTVCVFGGKI
jgi:hypothetical protein